MRMLEGHFYHVTCLVLFDLGNSFSMQSKSRIIGSNSKTSSAIPPSWAWWYRTRQHQDYVLSAWNKRAWNSLAEWAVGSGSIPSARTWTACNSSSPEGTASSIHDSPAPNITPIEMPSIRSTSAGSSVITGGLPIWPTFSFRRNTRRKCRKRLPSSRASVGTQQKELKAVARCSRISNATSPAFLASKKRSHNSPWADPRRIAKRPLPIHYLPTVRRISPRPANCSWKDRNASTNDFNALLAIPSFPCPLLHCPTFT